MAKLTGQELLDHRTIRRQQGWTNAEIVRDAGYTYIRKDGVEKLNYTSYYEEVLITQGKMFRVNVFIAEITPLGVQPVRSHSFTTSSRSARSIARKVRHLTKLTGVRCMKTIHNGVVKLYPKTGEVVAYNLP